MRDDQRLRGKLYMIVKLPVWLSYLLEQPKSALEESQLRIHSAQDMIK